MIPDCDRAADLGSLTISNHIKMGNGACKPTKVLPVDPNDWVAYVDDENKQTWANMRTHEITHTPKHSNWTVDLEGQWHNTETGEWWQASGTDSETETQSDTTEISYTSPQNRHWASPLAVLPPIAQPTHAMHIEEDTPVAVPVELHHM